MDINGAWKGACKALFKDEIGELGQFAAYLRRHIEPVSSRKSAVSGKDIAIFEEGFCPSARFIDNGEIAQFEKINHGARLDLDEIKDIDSIIGAVSDRFAYAGNILLGECSGIEGSNRCTDSHAIKDSQEMIGCKYSAYSTLLRDCEYSFGCTFTGEGKFGISCTQFFRSSRCFEALLTMACSDCYYTANLEGCSDCMFSFNLRNKSHCIGNQELPKDKYNAIKNGLLGQIRDELGSKKSVLSVTDLLSWGKGKPGNGPARNPPMKFPSKPPQREVEKSFSDTSALLLGRKLTGMQPYMGWLFSHVRTPFSHNSAKSGKPILVYPLKTHEAWAEGAVSLEEAWEMGRRSISAAQAESLQLETAKDALKEISYSTSDLVRGKNISVEECVNYFDCNGCFGGAGFYAEKMCACSFYTRECEAVFGCDLLFYSNFCIKCYHSSNLTRCFEVSDSKSSSGCYFCHNCENVHDSMFCFNAKSLRYAIGNVEIGKEAYGRIKKLVQEQIVQDLEKGKNLGISIYNIGCMKKKGK
jgi:hypothetical protein